MANEHILKNSKFAFRAFLTLMLMGIGAGIFFSSDDSSFKIIGSNMVTAGWASWIPTGSVQLKRTILPTISPTAPSQKKEEVVIPEE